MKKKFFPQDRLKVRSTKSGSQYVKLSDILMNEEIIEELKKFIKKK